MRQSPAVVAGCLVEPHRDPAPLFEFVDASLEDIAGAVTVTAEVRSRSVCLTGAAGDQRAPGSGPAGR